jgi:PadR family transcriptional regulator PadR
MRNAPDYIQDLLRGNTESVLLSLIETLDVAYGYRLIKEVQSRSRGLLQFKEGTIYPALRKLENEGLIKSEWQMLATGRKRRLYSITKKGKEALEKKIATWREFATTINLILNPDRA